MSLSLILKNIYSFLHVLEQAHGRPVAAWDGQSLDHAFKWATYCEQIYERARGKSYCEELDRQIVIMGALPWSLGNTVIALGLLAEATSKLAKALLQNPHLSHQLFEAVVSRYMSPEVLLQECWQISKSKSALQIGFALKKHVLPSIDHQTNNAEDHMTKCEAVILVRYVDKILADSGRHSTKCEEVLKNKLTSLSVQQHGLEVVARALTMVHQTEEPSIKGPSQTEQFLLQFLLNLPKQQLGELWQLPQELVCQLCAGYVNVYAIYMRHLVALAGSVTTSVAGAPTCQRDRNLLSAAQVTTTQTYRVIKTRLASLLHAGKHVSTATRKTIASLAQSSESGVWQLILNDCDLREGHEPTEGMT